MATYQVNSDGKAPKGLAAGDKVVTGGGTWEITGKDSNGNYQSKWVSDENTSTYKGSYSTVGSGGNAGNHYTGTMNATDPSGNAITVEYADGRLVSPNVKDGTVIHTGGGDYTYYNPATDYDLSQHLKDEAEARLEADLARLGVAFEKSMNAYDRAEKLLPEQYNGYRNQTAADTARRRRMFQEQVASSGLNTGTGGQADLALSSVYLGDLAKLDRQQAAAYDEIQRAKADLEAEYRAAIAEAEATGRADLANALYNELVRVQGLERQDEQTDYNRDQDAIGRADQQAAADLAAEEKAAAAQADAEQRERDDQLLAGELMASINDFSPYVEAGILTPEQAQAIADSKKQQTTEVGNGTRFDEIYATAMNMRKNKASDNAIIKYLNGYTNPEELTDNGLDVLLAALGLHPYA